MVDWQFWLMMVGSLAIDVAVVFWVLCIRTTAAGWVIRPGTIGLGRLMLAAVAMATVGALKLVMPLLFGFGMFGPIHLLYVDIAVFTPLVCLALLVAARNRRNGRPPIRLTRLVRVVVAVVLLIVPPVAAYATFVEPYRLQCETSDILVPAARSGRGDVRIGILSDVQTNGVSKHEHEAVSRMMACKPDIILIPGDFFQGSQQRFEVEFTNLLGLLSELRAPGGVYFVMGDCDRRNRVERLLAGSHVRLLLNEIVSVDVGDRRLTIGGVELRYTQAEARRTIRQLENLPGDGDIRILISHRPDVVGLLSENSRIDLVTSGHTHGGQIVVPFFGPPITYSHLPREVASGGLHVVGGNHLYISRGVGLERGRAPPVRFLCPPEISLLTLTTTDRGD